MQAMAWQTTLKTSIVFQLLSENVSSYMAVSLYIQSTHIKDMIRGFSSKVGFQFDFTKYRAAIAAIKIKFSYNDETIISYTFTICIMSCFHPG